MHDGVSAGENTSSKGEAPTCVRVLRLLRTCCLPAALMCLAGCWSPRIRPLPPEKLATTGTATFDGPRHIVFDACVAALRANGYAIEREEPAAGRVFTTPLPARTFPASREGMLLLRRYEIQVVGAAGSSAQVTATPMLFDAIRGRGGVRTLGARAPETAWTLAEEEAEWRRLFGAIKHRLALAATAQARGAALAGNTP